MAGKSTAPRAMIPLPQIQSGTPPDSVLARCTTKATPDHETSSAARQDGDVGEPIAKPKPLLRGVLHALAAILAIPATVLLVRHARAGTPTLMAVAYGISLILVFGVSGLYHTPMWSLTARRWMRRLDHSMIYVLIAGS